MSEPAPPASLIVPALVRQVASAGGFATVLHKGSDFGSALLLVHRRPGAISAHERLPRIDGRPQWTCAAEGEEAVSAFIERQRRFDSDLWVVELDIADVARFVPDWPPDD